MAHVGIPVYWRIAGILRSSIRAGKLEEDGHFPSEKQLAEQFQVSLMTIRQALTQLERDGLISKQRGRRSRIQKIALEPDVFTLKGSIEALIEHNIKATVRVINVQEASAPPRLASLFGLARLLKFERVRLIQGERVSYLVNYMSPKMGRQITKDLLRRVPMLKIMREKLGLRISRIDQVLNARLADTAIAERLGIEFGSPVMHSEGQVFLGNGSMVEFRESFHRGDRHRYRLELLMKSSLIELD